MQTLGFVPTPGRRLGCAALRSVTECCLTGRLVIAQRLARERDGLSIEAAFELYGLDPVRVALEHGAEPDDLDALAEEAHLRRRGSTCPWRTS